MVEEDDVELVHRERLQGLNPIALKEGHEFVEEPGFKKGSFGKFGVGAGDITAYELPSISSNRS